jgi:starvation-inducible DNA-binding protein
MEKASKNKSVRKFETRTFQTRNDLEPEIRSQVVDLLNAQLADTLDMYTIAKQAHWNVKGEHFFMLHELYDTIAEGILPYVDEIAERATALGGLAMGTVRMAAQSSRLEEYPPNAVNSMETVEVVAGCLANLAASTRAAADKAEELEDMDTNDLMIEISRDLDKWLWFVEAHLQGGEK